MGWLKPQGMGNIQQRTQWYPERGGTAADEDDNHSLWGEATSPVRKEKA